jgi:ABC-type dipeptide/oligopeptide/nickel transport system ATPase component
MTSLNPVFTVGSQIVEALSRHLGLTGDTARRRGIDLLKAVGIPLPDQRFDEYPHQLSGGMRQRVMIAMAIACEPELLIADEPTTALDVTVQAQIFDLLRSIQQTRGMGMILITHDMGVIAEMTDRVVVMYGGRPGTSLYARPRRLRAGIGRRRRRRARRVAGDRRRSAFDLRASNRLSVCRSLHCCDSAMP